MSILGITTRSTTVLGVFILLIIIGLGLITTLGIMEAGTPDLGLITTLGTTEDIILHIIIIPGLSTILGTMILGIMGGIMEADIPTATGTAIGMEHIVTVIITTLRSTILTTVRLAIC